MSIRDLKSTAAIMASVIAGTWENNTSGKILFFFLSCVQGFVSMPLTIHISNFSIAISLDSILWASVGILSHPKKGKEKNKYVELKNEEKPNNNLNNNIEETTT